MANYLAINSSDIFPVRAGILSVWAIYLPLSDFYSFLTPHLGDKKAVKEVELEGKMETISFGILGSYLGSYLEKYFLNHWA